MFPPFLTPDPRDVVSDADISQNDTVCAFDPTCKCQIASDHLSYGLMESVQDLIFDHVVSRF